MRSIGTRDETALNPVVCQVISTVTTYVVILLQMQNKTSWDVAGSSVSGSAKGESGHNS